MITKHEGQARQGAAAKKRTKVHMKKSKKKSLPHPRTQAGKLMLKTLQQAESAYDQRASIARWSGKDLLAFYQGVKIGDFNLALDEANPQVSQSLIKWLEGFKIDKPVTEHIQDIYAGYTFLFLNNLADTLDVSQVRLGQSLNISKRTLARRKTENKFTSGESERIMRLYRIIQKALEVFDGDIDATRQWIKNPKKALGGQIPMDFADTDIGGQEVIRLLGRIGHGVYS